MKSITRTIPTTTIVYTKIKVVSGEVQQGIKESINILGEKLDNPSAMKKVQDKIGRNEPFAIFSLTISEKTYEMPVEFFIENATEISKESANKTELKEDMIPSATDEKPKKMSDFLYNRITR